MFLIEISQFCITLNMKKIKNHIVDLLQYQYLMWMVWMIFFLRCPVYPPTLPTYCRKVAIPGQCCPKLSCDIPGTNGSYVPPSEVQVCTFRLSVVGENLNELLHVVFLKVPFFCKYLQFHLICKQFGAQKKKFFCFFFIVIN